MSVSLYYSASRSVALTGTETAAVERVVADHESSFPYQDEEALHLYEDGGCDPGDIVDGSTKMPTDFDRIQPVLDHVLGSVTELRRALPGAVWRVHLDDLDVPWDERAGYGLSFLDDDLPERDDHH